LKSQIGWIRNFAIKIPLVVREIFVVEISANFCETYGKISQNFANEINKIARSFKIKKFL
jgi:hypothetical protein